MEYQKAIALTASANLMKNNIWNGKRPPVIGDLVLYKAIQHLIVHNLITKNCIRYLVVNQEKFSVEKPGDACWCVFSELAVITQIETQQERVIQTIRGHLLGSVSEESATTSAQAIYDANFRQFKPLDLEDFYDFYLHNTGGDIYRYLVDKRHCIGSAD
jgi:hypothetical protein